MQPKIMIAPFGDPFAGENEDEIVNRLKKHLSNYPERNITTNIKRTDHGIGTDWHTITIEILLGIGAAFFTIPALHKQIRETLAEWKEIKKNITNFIEWLARGEKIYSYSKEILLLDALEYLDQKSDASELVLLNMIEIPGKSGCKEASFENTERLYYQYIFKENDERVFILLYSSDRKLVSYRAVGLDPRYANQFEERYDICESSE